MSCWAMAESDRAVDEDLPTLGGAVERGEGHPQRSFGGGTGCSGCLQDTFSVKHDFAVALLIDELAAAARP